MELMTPLVKPSRIFHAVCAYWLTSSAVSTANAREDQLTNIEASIKLGLSRNRPRSPFMPLILYHHISGCEDATASRCYFPRPPRFRAVEGGGPGTDGWRRCRC